MAEILLNHQTAAKVINATSTRPESVAGHESGCLLLDSPRHTTNASLERWRLDCAGRTTAPRVSLAVKHLSHRLYARPGFAATTFEWRTATPQTPPVSPDSDSAYEVADSLALAGAPKYRIHERGAYEFFAGLDGAGRPTWTRDLARRAAVFTNPGRCYRSGVTYNAALRRYLLVQPAPGAASRDRDGKIDVRFSGGLAIYDPSEAWGPWTTVFRPT